MQGGRGRVMAGERVREGAIDSPVAPRAGGASLLGKCGLAFLASVSLSGCTCQPPGPGLSLGAWLSELPLSQ